MESVQCLENFLKPTITAVGANAIETGVTVRGSPAQLAQCPGTGSRSDKEVDCGSLMSGEVASMRIQYNIIHYLKMLLVFFSIGSLGL